MKRKLILVGGLAAALGLSFSSVLAVVRRPVDPGDIIAALRTARREPATGVAQAQLKQLAASLAHDPTQYNRWITRHVNAILQSPAPESQRQLTELLERLTVPLNPYDLRNRITELSRLALSGAPGALARSHTGLQAYAAELSTDFSPTAIWAQMRLRDLIAAASNQNVSQMETLFTSMLAEITY